MKLLEPVETINYNFVAGVYGIFTCIFALFVVLQQYTEAVDGFYIVMAPFVPCFLWSLIVRQKWLTQQQQTVIEKKEE